MADEELVRVEADGAVLMITINRPDARNAVNKQVAESMAAALDRLDADPELAVGIVTGAGRGFSAGMDLKAFAGGEFPVVEGRGFAGIVQQSARKPLIAAIEGFALAGGLEIALACDIIVAARDAKLGIPEVGVGLFAGAGALWRLPRRVGLGQANVLALTAQPVVAEEGFRMGLVDKLADPGQAVATARELAAVIARNAPLAVAASKRIVDEGFTMGGDRFWEFQTSFFNEVFASKDALEGARAFAEKRPPNWQGA